MNINKQLPYIVRPLRYNGVSALPLSYQASQILCKYVYKLPNKNDSVPGSCRAECMFSVTFIYGVE